MKLFHPYTILLAAVYVFFSSFFSNIIGAPESYLSDHELVVSSNGLFYNNYNLGINTTNLVASLSVDGDINVSGDFTTGMRLVPFFIRGTGLNNDENAYLKVNDTVIYDGTDRGFHLAVFSKADMTLVSLTNYDTYRQNSSAESEIESLIDALEGLTNEHIAFLFSYDAWQPPNSIGENSDIEKEFKKNGLYRLSLAILRDDSSDIRFPYAAVFEPGGDVSTMKAVEILNDNSPNSTHAEIAGFVVDDSLYATGDQPNTLFPPDGQISGIVSKYFRSQGWHRTRMGGLDYMVGGTDAPNLVIDHEMKVRYFVYFSTAQHLGNITQTDPAYIEIVSNNVVETDEPSQWGNTGYSLVISFSDDEVGGGSERVAMGDNDFGNERFRFELSGGAYASNSFNSGGADFAEWVMKEASSEPGDVIGINPKTGRARPYRSGDAFIGVHSSDPGFIGNDTRGSRSEMSNDHILVGVEGQLYVNMDHVQVVERRVETHDGVMIGYLLANNRVLLRKPR